MKQEKFTQRALTALSDAHSLALRLDHTQVECAHLLSALLDAVDKTVSELVKASGWVMHRNFMVPCGAV